MLDQLEIADLVIINKTDLVNKKQKDAVHGYIKGINPESDIL
jgi:G3E family GTPase